MTGNRGYSRGLPDWHAEFHVSVEGVIGQVCAAHERDVVDYAAARTNDISGTWAFSVNMENGPQGISLMFVFTQQGEKATGTPPSGSGAERLNGTVKGER